MEESTLQEMMYTELYDLQDRVLETVFSIESGFYLTGGTCLHRFYYNKRYSDDLAFRDELLLNYNSFVNSIVFSI